MAEIIKLICDNCGKTLEFPAWDVKQRRKAGNKNFYCDRRCYLEHQGKKKKQRTEQIRKLRYSEDGSTKLTLKEIGDRFGISPQRVNAILRETE